MAKTFKNYHLQKPKLYDLETWNAALEPQARQTFTNDHSGLTLTYFTSMSILLFMHYNGEPEVHGMNHHKVYINADPGLTLTYFTARSSLVKYCLLCLNQTNSQVSVYRSSGLNLTLQLQK